MSIDSAVPVRAMTPGLRLGLLAIAGVIVWLGLSLFAFPADTDRLFAWTIEPPLTAAFLGASYWASTALAVTCAIERDWARGRAFAAPYLIAGVVLLAVTLVHIDRFHMDDVTGWAWLMLYAVFPPSVLVLLARQLRAPGGDPARMSPIPAAALVVLALQGAVMVALGAALVVVPEEVGSLWPWPLTPLTGRAVGTFVLAQGVLVLSVCRERDWDRVRPAMLQYLLLGALHLIALARFSGTPDWDRPSAWIYLAFVLGILATGAYGARSALTARRRTEAPPQQGPPPHGRQCTNASPVSSSVLRLLSTYAQPPPAPASSIPPDSSVASCGAPSSSCVSVSRVTPFSRSAIS
jgi:hypothetical protein